FASNDEFEIVPLARRGRGIANPFHRAAAAANELPEHEIVLKRVGAHGEIVSVWLEIEKDAGALVDASLEWFEAHGDLTLAKVLYATCDRVRVIGIGFDIIEKLGVALAVNSTGLIGEAGRGLALFPFAAINREHAFITVCGDHPVANNSLKRR